MVASPDPAVQAAANAKAIAEAERDAAKARLELATANAELATVEATLAAKNAGAVATAEKAGYDKVKAAADARSAAIAADQAATKAAFGSVAANSVAAGTVEVGTGAGTSEATILAARSLDVVSALVAKKVRQDVVVIAGTDPPQFGDMHVYEFRKQLMATLFQTANLASRNADSAFEQLKAERKDLAESSGIKIETVGEVITAAGAGLEAAAKIASFFQTDFKFQNVPVAGLTNDVLAAAVAGRVAVAGARADTKYSAFLPGQMINSAGATSIFNELSSTVEDRLKSGENKAIGDAALAELALMLKAAKAEKDKVSIQSVINMYTRSTADETTASKTFDDYFAALSAGEGEKTLLGRIVEQRNLSELLSRGYATLYVSVTMQGGTSYTRKSLWNFFGAQPFFVSGGAVIHWVLVDKSGSVIGSALETEHSGYKSVSRLDF